MPIDPMTGQPHYPAEDVFKQMFAESSSNRLMEVAAEDAALQQQLAQTRYARAHAKVAQQAHPVTGKKFDYIGAYEKAGAEPPMFVDKTGRAWYPNGYSATRNGELYYPNGSPADGMPLERQEPSLATKLAAIRGDYARATGDFGGAAHAGGGNPQVIKLGPGDVQTEAQAREGYRAAQMERQLNQYGDTHAQAARAAYMGGGDDLTWNRPISEQTAIIKHMVGTRGERGMLEKLRAFNDAKARGKAGVLSDEDLKDAAGTSDFRFDTAKPNAGFRMERHENAGRPYMRATPVEPGVPMPTIDKYDATNDDIRKAIGYTPEMFAGMDGAEAIKLIAGQLDAQRKRALGAWDPSVAIGGSI